MGYPNSRKCIRMLEGSIRMPKRAFGYTENKIWTAEAEGIRIPKDGIRMPETAFGYPIGHSDTLNKLLNGGYPDAGKCIRMHIEAIRILEESIRMPATQRLRTTMN